VECLSGLANRFDPAPAAFATEFHLASVEPFSDLVQDRRHLERGPLLSLDL
jgi:hypothetical protein